MPAAFQFAVGRGSMLTGAPVRASGIHISRGRDVWSDLVPRETSWLALPSQMGYHYAHLPAAFVLARNLGLQLARPS